MIRIGQDGSFPSSSHLLPVWHRKELGNFWNTELMRNFRSDFPLSMKQWIHMTKKWGSTLEELAEISPRQESLREEYKEAAREIVRNSFMLRDLMTTKRLPLKELGEIMPVHRKKLERGRIYIIAMVLAMVGNLSYVDIRRGGGK